MSGVGPVSGLGAVLQLRAEILSKSQSLAPVAGTAPSGTAPAVTAPAVSTPAVSAADGKPASFGSVMTDALNAVHRMQSESSAQSAAWERGETHDIASVMLSRQKASIAFEATVQARNRLLSAYRDVMNMPV